MQRDKERGGRAGVRRQRGAEICREKGSVRASLTAVVAIYNQALLHSPEKLSHLPHTFKSAHTYPHTHTYWKKLFDIQKYIEGRALDWLMYGAQPANQDRHICEWMSSLALRFWFGSQCQVFVFFGFIDSSVIIHLVYQRECCVDKKRNSVYDWVEREGEEAALPITSCLSCQKRTYERKRGPAREEEK